MAADVVIDDLDEPVTEEYTPFDVIELAHADTGEPASVRTHTPPAVQVVQPAQPRPGVAYVRIPDPGSPTVDLEDRLLTGGAGDSPEVDGLGVLCRKIDELLVEADVQGKHLLSVVSALRNVSIRVDDTDRRVKQLALDMAELHKTLLGEALGARQAERQAEQQQQRELAAAMQRERQQAEQESERIKLQASIERRNEWENFARRHLVAVFAALTATVAYMLGDSSIGWWYRQIFDRSSPP